MSKIPVLNGIEDMREWVFTLSNKKLISHIKNEGTTNQRVITVIKTVEKIGMSRTHKKFLQEHLIWMLAPRYKKVT